MAKRFHSGFLSDNGAEYDIEIHDSTHGGASTAFVLDARGFELSEDGETDNLHHPVMGSRFAFTMLLQEDNRVLIGGFIGELVTAPEKQFQVIVYSGGGTVLEWMGNVLPDISKRPDISPNNFEVVAVDGLGALAKVDYNNAGTVYTGKETLLQHALNCLNKIGTFATFLTTETALTTVVNWWEDSLTFSSSNDPFALTRVDHAVFYEEQPGDNKKYLSCLDVLKYVVQRVNAKIYWSHGSFRIEQWGERDNVNIRERTYQKDGTGIGNTSATHDITLNQAAEARLSGGLFEWLPIVRRVEVAYKAKNWLNRIQFFSWSSVSSTAVTITGIESGNNTAARISIKINNIIANTGYTTAANVVIVYKMKVKIGNYWLRRKLNSIDNYLVSYGAVTWADTDNDYYFHVVIPYNSIPAVSSSHQVESAFLDFVTPPLPTSDDLIIKFDYFAVRRLDNGAGVQDVLAVTFSTQYPILQLWANGDPVTEFMDITHFATDDDGGANSEVIKIETIIGDTYTTNSFSKLEVSGGLGWANSSIWRVGNSGGYADIGDLLAKEVLALRKKAVRTYSGTIRGTGLAHSRWSFDGSFWVLLNGSYDANMDEWSGKWAAIASTKTAITNPTPVPTLPPPYIPVPPGIGSDLEGLIVPPASNVISSAATGDVLTVGVISTIPTKQLLNAGAFLQGQVVTLVNPSTGNTQNFTVTADSDDGDNSISVSGYAADEFPVGSFIVVSPQNNTVQGYGGASSGGAQSTAQVSDWWDIFQQWWDVDNTNDPNWPIEAPNVGFETDENAGDGATPGFRLDGDGLQSFTASSSTPGVKIGLAGKLELAGLATGTSTDFLILEGGEVKQKSVTVGVTDHGALTGLGDDDHTQYHNDARGDARYFQETEHLNTSAGAGDAGKPIKLNSSGRVDATMLDDVHIIKLVAVSPFTTVGQTANLAFPNGAWLVPDYLGGYRITRIDYALCANSSGSGSWTVGFRNYNTANSSTGFNINAVTFSTSAVRASNTSAFTLTAGHWMHPEGGSTPGTLDGTVTGLLITLKIQK